MDDDQQNLDSKVPWRECLEESMDDDQRLPRMRSSSIPIRNSRITSPYGGLSRTKVKIRPAFLSDSPLSSKKPNASQMVPDDEPTKRPKMAPEDEPAASTVRPKMAPAKKSSASTIGPKMAPAKKSSASTVGPKTPRAKKLSAASTIGPKTLPSKKLSAAASPVVGAKTTPPHAKKSAASPVLGHEMTNAKKIGPALYPSSASSNSSKKTPGAKEDVTPSLRSLSIQRSLLFKDKQGTGLSSESTTDHNSPEATLLKHLEELSNMKSSLQMTGAIVLELFSCSDSKFTEAWKEAERGVKRLEEGLGIIAGAQKLLREGTSLNHAA